jgi:hypothetical protein
MKKFLVGKNVAYAASKATPTVVMSAVTPDLLADGSLGVYFMNADGTILVVSNSTAAAGQITIANAVLQISKSPLGQSKLVIGVGTPTGCEVTDPFVLSEVANGYSKEFAASVLHKVAQTITPPAVPTVLDTYVLHINFFNEEQDFETYDMTGSYANASAVAAALLPKVLANPNSKITAVNNAGVIELTSKEAGLAFSTAWDLPAGASGGSKTTTGYSLGNGGEGALLAKQEYTLATYKGFLNPYDAWLKQYPKRVDVAANYDIYYINLVRTFEAKHMMNATNDHKREYIIAVPDAMAAVGADGWSTVFAGLFDADVSETGDAVAAT